MTETLIDVFINGNLSWGNMAVVAVILGSIFTGIRFQAYVKRKGQKSQAVDEIRAMPCYSVDGVIDLPTATGTISACIEGITDDSFVVLSSIGRKHYIPVSKFASGDLGSRISLHIEKPIAE